MEEKKELKVSLGTVVSIFIILVLIVALAGMYFYYNNKLDSNKEIYKNTELDNEIIEKQPLENVNNNQDGEDYETTGKRLFEQYLQTRKEIVDYKINSCKMVSYYNNEFICKMNYDVKVEGNAENSDWIAGNGEPEGNWVKGKNVFLSFKKINGVYTYNEEVGQMTAWDVSYFENEEEADKQIEENAISKQIFTPLSMYTATKKVVDDNREGYYISKENYDVNLSIREGKVYFTSFLNNELYSILGINENDIKVSEKRAAEVTGFTKKVVDAEICCWQTIETMYFVFLMEDGTLEYSSIKNMVTNLTTEGKVENVSNIQRIHECAVGLKNDMGSINTIIALDYENNMYDIGYILFK